MRAAPVHSPSTERRADARLSPEARLILGCAAGIDGERLRDLARGVAEWEKVLWLSEQERATALIWERLRPLRGAELPEHVAAQLERIAMVSDFRMLHLRQRLQQVVRTLSEAGIEIVLLKGAALSSLVYDSVVQRPMSDIDALVAPGRSWEARKLLLGAGWAGDADERADTIYEHHHHLPPLADAAGTGIKLELHTSLFLPGHPFVLTADRVWRDRQPIDIGGVRAYVPHTHHLLLHTCLHFAWSNQLRSGTWRTFRDVQRLTGRHDLDWDEFVAMATSGHAASLCYWTFRLSASLAGVKIPDAVIERLRPRLPEMVLRRLERHYVHHSLATEWICPSQRLGKRMWELGMRPSASGYGDARPWGYEDRISGSWSEELTGAEKIGSHLRKLARWGRYFRVLFQPAT